MNLRMILCILRCHISIKKRNYVLIFRHNKEFLVSAIENNGLMQIIIRVSQLMTQICVVCINLLGYQ